jgi:hypothetical protein
MTGHPTDDGVDGEGHLDPATSQRLRGPGHGMVGLRDGDAVARHHDDAAG